MVCITKSTRIFTQAQSLSSWCTLLFINNENNNKEDHKDNPKDNHKGNNKDYEKDNKKDKVLWQGPLEVINGQSSPSLFEW